MSQSNKQMSKADRKKSNKDSSRTSDEDSNKNQENNQVTPDKEINTPTTPSESDPFEKVKPKTILEALIQTLKTSSTRPSSKNGLYGDTSVPTTLPKMPYLTGPSAAEFSDWLTKAINYFQTNGLEEIVTLDPASSLALAYESDPHTPIATIKGIWKRLHTRAVGIIKTAVESVLGTEMFDEIDAEQEEIGECNIYEVDPENKGDMPWLDSFISKNANLVWERLKERQQRYTAHDKWNLVRRLFDLKYQVGSNPVFLRRRFAAILKNLRSAEIELHQDLLMAAWYSAIPKELNFLKASIGDKDNVTLEDIYNRLVKEYSARDRNSKGDRRNPKRPRKEDAGSNQTELAAGAQEQKPNPKFRKTKRRKVGANFNPNPECPHCGRTNHKEDKCWKKYPHLIPKKFKTLEEKDEENDTEYNLFFDSVTLNQPSTNESTS